nr:immunoglobulin heavy chain junction region [Macaca mulatta]MOW99474.1 immunoglobulin heavy chain junction region [Macaca mulatta]MOX00148.1 immunoglobulin heavy chain junction region [Macaca mulatta]MOX00941.1 immunoglobulin heavy chain junction region [Macaca mulatta]MOX01258.1 immunoglobulin heavy chain junction region [Macaca mulatta]
CARVIGAIIIYFDFW